MKNKLLTISILIALVLGACAYEMITIDNVFKDSCEIIDSMSDLERQNKKDELLEASDKLYQLWGEKMPILSMFVQHEIVDEIEQSIAIIKSSVEQDDSDTFQTEITRAAIQIQSLRDTEFPYIENIL